MESPGHGQNELRRIDEMCSERWDIGAPNKYFHLQYMERIAARLGCLLIVDRDEAEISERRADYDAHLKSLSDHINHSRLRGDLAAAL